MDKMPQHYFISRGIFLKSKPKPEANIGFISFFGLVILTLKNMESTKKKGLRKYGRIQ